MVYSEAIGELDWKYLLKSDTLILTRKTSYGENMTQEMVIQVLNDEKLTLVLDGVITNMTKVKTDIAIKQYIDTNDQEIFYKYLDSYIRRRNRIK